MKRLFVLTSVVALAAAAIAGCAGAAKGPSDEELIKSTLSKWSDGIKSKNLDTILSCYSENFRDGDGRGKAEVRRFIADVIEAGYFEGADVLFDQSATNVDGNTATVTPITLKSDMGAVGIRLELGKEKDGWLITGSGEV